MEAPNGPHLVNIWQIFRENMKLIGKLRGGTWQDIYQIFGENQNLLVKHEGT